MYGCFARNLSQYWILPERRSLFDFNASIKYRLLRNQHQWRTYVPVHHPCCKFRSQRIPNHGYASSPLSSSSSSSSAASFRRSKSGFLGWYLGLLESRPLITKSVTTSLIYIAADLCSQMIALNSFGSLNLIRTLRMSGYGLLILGPAQHMWFNFLSGMLPKRDVLTTLKKILMGQAIFGPCITVIFFSYNAALQGERGHEIMARMRRDLLPTLINGLIYWPICDFFTYKFVLVHLQPLANSSCAFFWTIYLTYMASLAKVISV